MLGGKQDQLWVKRCLFSSPSAILEVVNLHIQLTFGFLVQERCQHQPEQSYAKNLSQADVKSLRL